MIKLLVIAAVVSIAVRWLTGAWPWQWLSTRPSAASELARARRLLGVPAVTTRDEVRAAYRRHAADMHPDRGGSDARLAALTEARDLLLANLPENPK
ncbi:MAG TPA: molecular chaperone DnaJ [Qipengyuania sp.]|nr:molecular chaperone DnaJ [Qipengyuania sp.]